MLQTKGKQIINSEGQPINLRGTCIGGWLHMENFINGYPGAEHSLRYVMAQELGEETAVSFFESTLDNFFTETDCAFIRSTGANVVRIALNYRQFERDEDPYNYLESGFRRLDQAIEWCAKHGLYVILDLHAVQGWQNSDWHSDNANRITMIWEFKQFQDRFVQLWEALADRYKDNETVAGYDIMNEPLTAWPNGRLNNNATPNWQAINSLFRRVVAAIRAIDPHHIIFIEGDNFAHRFSGFDAPFADNLVYSGHCYTPPGFGPGTYPGTIRGESWDLARLEETLMNHEGVKFMQKHDVPLWMGEFGSVYNGNQDELPNRYRALDDMLGIFNKNGIHWTTWTYKDVNVMGWVHPKADSPYIKRVQPMLNAKHKLRTDLWMGWLPDTDADRLTDELINFAGDLIDQTPTPDEAHFLRQAALSGYISHWLQPHYARLFKGLSSSELNMMQQSFRFEQCDVRSPLIEIIRKRTAE